MSDSSFDSDKEADVAYGAYQNIKMNLSAMLQSGVDPFEAIYGIAEILEKQSGEHGYAANVAKDIRSIYGIALGYEKPLNDEILETKSRSEKIRIQLNNDGYTDDQRSRMEFALKAHEKMISILEKRIGE